MTIDKDGDGEIDQWGCANALQWALDAFIYTNGGHFLNEDYTQVVIDGQQEFIDAFQYFADLTCKYNVTPTVEEEHNRHLRLPQQYRVLHRRYQAYRPLLYKQEFSDRIRQQLLLRT